MFLLRRSFATFGAGLLLCAALAAVSQAAAPPRHQAAAATPKYSVAVARCQDSALYDGREVSFRTRIARTGSKEQRLEVRAALHRKLNESKKFSRVKLPGLSKPTTSKDAAATVYKRKITIRNVETAARYKLRVTFTWRSVETGKVIREKSVWSKVCRLRTGLPKLAIEKVESLRELGTKNVTHRVTVVNKGASEALDIPVAVYAPGADATVKQIESLAPGASEQVSFSGLGCGIAEIAQLDPVKQLARLGAANRVPVPLPGCATDATG